MNWKQEAALFLVMVGLVVVVLLAGGCSDVDAGAALNAKAAATFLTGVLIGWTGVSLGWWWETRKLRATPEPQRVPPHELVATVGPCHNGCPRVMLICQVCGIAEATCYGKSGLPSTKYSAMLCAWQMLCTHARAAGIAANHTIPAYESSEGFRRADLPS